MRIRITKVPRNIQQQQSNISQSGSNMMAIGGDVQTHGGDFSTGMRHINSGGTHEENPYEGVQVGVDPEGKPNLVEEGEVIFNDYVYSNRIELDDEAKERFHFSQKQDITYADAAKKLEKEASERPNDPISTDALQVQMANLAEEQERQKQEMQAEEAREAFAQLSPEEQVAVMQQVQSQQQGPSPEEQAMMEQQAMQEQGMGQPQMSPEEAAMMEQQMAMQGGGQPMMGGAPPMGMDVALGQQGMPQQPVMAYGGQLNESNKFLFGGDEYNPPKKRNKSVWGTLVEAVTHPIGFLGDASNRQAPLVATSDSVRNTDTLQDWLSRNHPEIPVGLRTKVLSVMIKRARANKAMYNYDDSTQRFDYAKMWRNSVSGSFGRGEGDAFRNWTQAGLTKEEAFVMVFGKRPEGYWSQSTNVRNWENKYKQYVGKAYQPTSSNVFLQPSSTASQFNRVQQGSRVFKSIDTTANWVRKVYPSMPKGDARFIAEEMYKYAQETNFKTPPMAILRELYNYGGTSHSIMEQAIVSFSGDSKHPDTFNGYAIPGVAELRAYYEGFRKELEETHPELFDGTGSQQNDLSSSQGKQSWLSDVFNQSMNAAAGAFGSLEAQNAQQGNVVPQSTPAASQPVKAAAQTPATGSGKRGQQGGKRGQAVQATGTSSGRQQSTTTASSASQKKSGKRVQQQNVNRGPKAPAIDRTELANENNGKIFDIDNKEIPNEGNIFPEFAARNNVAGLTPETLFNSPEYHERLKNIMKVDYNDYAYIFNNPNLTDEQKYEEVNRLVEERRTKEIAKLFVEAYYSPQLDTTETPIYSVGDYVPLSARPSSTRTGRKIKNPVSIPPRFAMPVDNTTQISTQEPLATAASDGATAVAPTVVTEDDLRKEGIQLADATSSSPGNNVIGIPGDYGMEEVAAKPKRRTKAQMRADRERAEKYNEEWFLNRAKELGMVDLDAAKIDGFKYSSDNPDANLANFNNLYRNWQRQQAHDTHVKGRRTSKKNELFDPKYGTFRYSDDKKHIYKAKIAPEDYMWVDADNNFITQASYDGLPDEDKKKYIKANIKKGDRLLGYDGKVIWEDYDGDLDSILNEYTYDDDFKWKPQDATKLDYPVEMTHSKLSNLRYAPFAVNLIDYVQNLLNKPDYRRAQALIDTAANYAPMMVSPMPVYSGYKYTPKDTWELANAANAIGAGLTRSIMNSGLTPGGAAANMVAGAYNTIRGLGDNIQKVNEYNDKQRIAKAEFDLRPQQINAANDLQAQLANQGALYNAQLHRYQGLATGNAMMDALDAQRNTALNTNFNNIGTSLGNIGDEEDMKDILAWLERTGVLKSNNYSNRGKYDGMLTYNG